MKLMLIQHILRQLMQIQTIHHMLPLHELQK